MFKPHSSEQGQAIVSTVGHKRSGVNTQVFILRNWSRMALISSRSIFTCAGVVVPTWACAGAIGNTDKPRTTIGAVDFTGG